MTDRERRRLKWTFLAVKCSLELYIAAVVTILLTVKCG